MAVIHQSRTGKTYYLHTGPKRGGGVQHFFSTKPTGTLAESVPEGFEMHETVNGQVFLRRVQPRLIQEEEENQVRQWLGRHRTGHRYKLEIRGGTLTLYESESKADLYQALAPHLPAREWERLDEQFASYQAVLRFTLSDPEKRLFAPERFCFRGSVDGWISIGRPATLAQLAGRYLKHLGRESFYDLY
jgi:hypothetical protein